MRKRKRTGIGLAAVALAAVLALSACGNGLSKKAQEMREQGIEAYENSDYETAAASFEDALKEAGDRVTEGEKELRYYLGAAKYGAGDYDGALEQYNKLIEEEEDSYKPYFLRGSLYAKTGKIEEADADFKEAIIRNGADYDLYTSIYESFRDAGEEAQGKVYLKRAKKIEPKEPEEFCKLGYICYLLEDYDSARTHLKEAVENDVLDAMLYLGMTEAKAGNRDEAVKSFEEYANRKKEDAEAIGKLGSAMLSCDMAEESIAYFEKAVSMTEGEEQRNAKKGLISAYEHTGEFEKARDLAEEYTAEYPQDKEMSRELEFLKTR